LVKSVSFLHFGCVRTGTTNDLSSLQAYIKHLEEKDKSGELEKARLNNIVEAKIHEMAKLEDAKKAAAEREKKLADEVEDLYVEKWPPLKEKSKTLGVRTSLS
jgi:hypothetical protein